MESIKCVVVGDGCVGKTGMLTEFAYHTFPKEYVPTIFDSYVANIFLNDKSISMQLWDTSGEEGYGHLRPLCYTEADIFIICFSLVSPYSYENVENIWVPELKKYSKNTPYILVGLKSDLRDDFNKMNDEFRSKGYSPISSENGLKLMKNIGAENYIECSSMKPSSLNDVFETAAKIALKGQDNTKIKSQVFDNCCLLI